MTFNIYRLTNGGKATWAATAYGTDSPQAALEQKHRTHADLIPVGGTFLVVDPTNNPWGRQVVFTLERSEAPVRAVPAAL